MHVVIQMFALQGLGLRGFGVNSCLFIAGLLGSRCWRAGSEANKQKGYELIREKGRGPPGRAGRGRIMTRASCLSSLG